MRGLKYSLIVGSCLALTGCSSIWSGVADFAGYMSEKTEFLSLRKSKTISEHVNNTTPNNDGLIQSSAGMYAPTGWTGETANYASSTSMVATSTQSGYLDTGFSDSGLSADGCPDGSYLTAENSCMLLATDDYQLPPLPDYNQSANLQSSFPQCPDNTYLTPENTCMQFDTDPLPTLAGSVSENYSSLESSYSNHPSCPDGTYLSGNNECRMLDDGNNDLFMTDANPYAVTNPSIEYGSLTSMQTGFQHITLPSAESLDESCPDGTYRDPENFCMRLNAMP